MAKDILEEEFKRFVLKAKNTITQAKSKQLYKIPILKQWKD